MAKQMQGGHPPRARTTDGMTAKDTYELLGCVGNALKPKLSDVVEQPLPGPMLQMLSLLERNERQHAQDEDEPKDGEPSR